MKVAICEDDKFILNKIVLNTRECLGSDCIIHPFTEIRKLDAARDLVEYDIYLLDIELEDGSGFEYAKVIRGTNKTCKITFITSHTEYSIEGYKYDVNGYLLKPFKKEDIEELLYKLSSDFTRAYTPLTIVDNYKDILINLEEIEYIKKDGRKTIIYTHNDFWDVNHTLKYLLEKINKKYFFSVNRGLVINTLKIEDFVQCNNNVVLKLINHSIDLKIQEFKLLSEFLIENRG